jgi:hypothetical protein
MSIQRHAVWQVGRPRESVAGTIQPVDPERIPEQDSSDLRQSIGVSPVGGEGL